MQEGQEQDPKPKLHTLSAARSTFVTQHTGERSKYLKGKTQVCDFGSLDFAYS